MNVLWHIAKCNLISLSFNSILIFHLSPRHLQWELGRKHNWKTSQHNITIASLSISTFIVCGEKSMNWISSSSDHKYLSYTMHSTLCNEKSSYHFGSASLTSLNITSRIAQLKACLGISVKRKWSSIIDNFIWIIDFVLRSSTWIWNQPSTNRD